MPSLQRQCRHIRYLQSGSVRFPGGEGQQRFLLEAVKQVSDPAASTARDEVLLTRVTDVFEVTCPRIASAYVKSTATSAHLQVPYEIAC